MHHYWLCKNNLPLLGKQKNTIQSGRFNIPFTGTDTLNQLPTAVHTHIVIRWTYLEYNIPTVWN